MRAEEDLDSIQLRNLTETQKNLKFNQILPISNSYPLSEEALINSKIEDNDEKMCRICMEIEANNNVLITPCRCSGSVKFIHEICLKTWLVSQAEDIAEASCELCKEPYEMEFKITNACVPSEYCKQGIVQCLFIPLLLFVMGMLFLVAYLLSDKYLDNADDQEKGYIIALIATCGISGFVISMLIINSLKEACTTAKLTDWTILSKNFVNEVIILNEKDEKIKDDTLLDRSALATPVVLVIPKKMKIGKHKVKTPNLNPPMVPLYRYGILAAFTPKYMTPSVSISPSRSFNPVGPSFSDPYLIREPASPQYQLSSSKSPFLSFVQ